MHGENQMRPRPSTSFLRQTRIAKRTERITVNKEKGIEIREPSLVMICITKREVVALSIGEATIQDDIGRSTNNERQKRKFIRGGS